MFLPSPKKNIYRLITSFLITPPPIKALFTLNLVVYFLLSFLLLSYRKLNLTYLLKVDINRQTFSFQGSDWLYIISWVDTHIWLFWHPAPISMINAERLDLLLRLLRILKCDLGGVWGRCVCEYIIAASCTVGWNSTLRSFKKL